MNTIQRELFELKMARVDRLNKLSNNCIEMVRKLLDDCVDLQQSGTVEWNDVSEDLVLGYIPCSATWFELRCYLLPWRTQKQWQLFEMSATEPPHYHFWTYDLESAEKRAEDMVKERG